MSTIIAAAISAAATIFVVVWTNRGLRADVLEVHKVVNSRLEAALATIKSLEEQVRNLKTSL